MNGLEPNTELKELSDDTVMLSLLSNPANRVTLPLPGVQPIGDVEDFLAILPHLTPGDDDGFYEAIVDLRRRRRSVTEGK